MGPGRRLPQCEGRGPPPCPSTRPIRRSASGAHAGRRQRFAYPSRLDRYLRVFLKAGGDRPAGQDRRRSPMPSPSKVCHRCRPSLQLEPVRSCLCYLTLSGCHGRPKGSEGRASKRRCIHSRRFLQTWRRVSPLAFVVVPFHSRDALRSTHIRWHFEPGLTLSCWAWPAY